MLSPTLSTRESTVSLRVNVVTPAAICTLYVCKRYCFWVFLSFWQVVDDSDTTPQNTFWKVKRKRLKMFLGSKEFHAWQTRPTLCLLSKAHIRAFLDNACRLHFTTLQGLLWARITAHLAHGLSHKFQLTQNQLKHSLCKVIFPATHRCYVCCKRKKIFFYKCFCALLMRLEVGKRVTIETFNVRTNICLCCRYIYNIYICLFVFVCTFGSDDTSFSSANSDFVCLHSHAPLSVNGKNFARISHQQVIASFRT